MELICCFLIASIAWAERLPGLMAIIMAAAKIPIMAITINSSIRVNACLFSLRENLAKNWIFGRGWSEGKTYFRGSSVSELEPKPNDLISENRGFLTLGSLLSCLFSLPRLPAILSILACHVQLYERGLQSLLFWGVIWIKVVKNSGVIFSQELNYKYRSQRLRPGFPGLM